MNDENDWCKFFEQYGGDDDDEKNAAELEQEAALAQRIAEYLVVNRFANLQEAAEKGWGDTRPLTKETIQ